MSLLSNIDEVAFSTAYEIDKMYTTKFSGSFAVAASSTPGTLSNVAIKIETNFNGENVLPVMQFSTDNTNWLDAGDTEYTAGAPLTTTAAATCYTTSTTLVIVGANFTGSSKTFYYRAVLILDD